MAVRTNEKGQSLVDLVISLGVIMIMVMTVISFKWTKPKEVLTEERAGELIQEAIVKYKLSGNKLTELSSVDDLKPYFKSPEVFNRIKPRIQRVEIAEDESEVKIEGVNLNRRIKLPKRKDLKDVSQEILARSSAVPVEPVKFDPEDFEVEDDEDTVDYDDIIKEKIGSLERLKKLRERLIKEGKISDEVRHREDD